MFQHFTQNPFICTHASFAVALSNKFHFKLKKNGEKKNQYIHFLQFLLDMISPIHKYTCITSLDDTLFLLNTMNKICVSSNYHLIFLCPHTDLWCVVCRDYLQRYSKNTYERSTIVFACGWWYQQKKTCCIYDKMTAKMLLL